MDRQFAGVVAVALLGCAVILAIAYQISEGLAMEAERRTGGAKAASEVQSAPRNGPVGSGPTLSLDFNAASADTGRVREPGEAEYGSTEPPATATSGPDHGEYSTSTAREPGNMPGDAKGTPTPAKEINPAAGHTVSPQPADEIEERTRKTPLREQGQTRIPTVTSNDPTSPGAPDFTAPSGAAGVEAAPAIEMIRGTRRSTEPISASENED